jgi:hypothetical protein
MPPMSSLYTRRVLVQELGGNATLVAGIVSKYGKRLHGGTVFGRQIRKPSTPVAYVPEADKVSVPTTN